MGANETKKHDSMKNSKKRSVVNPGSAPHAVPRLSCQGGLDDFAGGCGTSSDEVLAVISFLLVGMAGSEAWLGGHYDGAPLGKLDLLVRRRDGALGRMAGQLVAKLRGLNRSLTAGMADYSMDWIQLTRRGAFAGGSSAKFADPEDTRKARERLLRDLRESEAKSSLEGDLENEKEALRIEALLHPQFLLESVRCRDLEVALDLCHQRTAVVVGLKTRSSRAGSEPAREFRSLLDLMEGLATPCWEGGAKGATTRSRVTPLKAHVLLDAEDDDLSLMARLLPELAESFLWLTPSRTTAPKPPRRPSETATIGRSKELMDLFTKAAMEILSQRRIGATVTATFSVGNGALELTGYWRVMERFRRWIGYLGNRHQLDPGPVVFELPGALVFGLGFLCRQSGTTLAPPPGVMAEAFRSARRLARRHCRALALHLKAQQVGQGLELARGIVSNLEEKGPMKLRQLVRCFGDQRRERFDPVIGALIELGVLAWRDDGMMESGKVEISEVENRLGEALLAPSAADSVGKKGKMPKPPARSRIGDSQTLDESAPGKGRKQAKKQARKPRSESK